MVEEKRAFDAWLKEQPTFKQSMAAAKTDAEKEIKLVLSKEPAQSGSMQAASFR